MNQPSVCPSHADPSVHSHCSCFTLLLCPHDVAACDGKDDGDKEDKGGRDGNDHRGHAVQSDNPSPGWLVVSQPGSCRCKCPESKQVEAVVNVAANGAVDLVSLLARALVPPDVQPVVRLEQAVGVLVAQLLLGAGVGALLPRSGSNVSNDSDIVGACVGRALNALCLLLLWLEGANGTSLALVVCGIEELTGHTDWTLQAPQGWSPA